MFSHRYRSYFFCFTQIALSLQEIFTHVLVSKGSWFTENLNQILHCFTFEGSHTQCMGRVLASGRTALAEKEEAFPLEV